MTPAEFFAAGHPVMQRLVAWGPVKFGSRFAVAAVVGLMLPARIIGIHSIPGIPGKADDLGFWFEANWSLMFPVVLPLLFGTFIYVIARAQQAFEQLSGEKLRVITASGGGEANGYTRYVAGALAARSRLVTYTAVALAVILTLFDTLTILRFLIWDIGAPPIDWAVGYTVVPHVSKPANIVFTFVAYTAQATAIYLGFFFVMKFWLLLHTFSASMLNSSVNYEFNPLVHDPYHRLGLRPLGTFMNAYLCIVLIFEAYVLGRRLQLIGKGDDYKLAEYLTTIIGGAQGITNLLKTELYQWQTVNTGMWLLLIFVTLPLVVAAYFPLWTLRRFVTAKRDELWHASAREHQEAKASGNEERAQELEVRMMSLEGTQLWPNGDAAGWRLLTLSLIIAVAAWAPPLLAGLSAVAVSAEVGHWLIGLRGRLRR